MRLSKKHRFVLYALYQYLKEANKQLSDKPLEMSVSKIVFIEALMKSKIADKSQRALYKNLELLEKKKLIEYENKFLKPTPRGLKLFLEMHKEISPYFHMVDIIKTDIGNMGRKIQTFFK